MTKLRLGVIFGGRSGEHEISLRSARSVLRELNKDKYEMIPIAITKSGHWYGGPDVLEKLEQGDLTGLLPVTFLPEPGNRNLYHRAEDKGIEILAEVDVMFPVLHGTFGEDGTIQGIFEMAEMPYVGAGVLASSVGMDKVVFKDVMKSWGIPIVDYALLTGLDISTDIDLMLQKAEAVGPYPLFTKPVNQGSSVGINKCNNRSDLIEGLLDAAQYDLRVMVEKGLNAREIEVSVLGNDIPEASIPGEVVPGDQFYSYRAKYIDDTSELLIPAPIDDGMAEEIRTLAVNAFKAIDGAGMARVDFLLDRESGKPFVNELNTIPGFTSISMYPKLWEATGLTYSDLLDRLIDLAFERHAQKMQLLRTYEGGK
ncbi:MAG: D-alanine--D-alanine ligase A [Chloroflexi bacterium RBG_16_48_8]|nr:MAG: D-alanine--D-alanine ligase A [Chloroflexi bacterium RBG_16_48_8]